MHDAKLMSSLLSCGHQCLKPLLYCEHLCSAICHEGIFLPQAHPPPSRSDR
jgi:hypothetical protein